MKKPTYTVADYLQRNLNQFKRTLRTGVVVAFMFTAVAAKSAPVAGYQSQFQHKQQIVMSLPAVNASSHFEAINKIEALQPNWDEEGAVTPNAEVLKNSRKLLSLLKPCHLQALSPADIYASAYGSVVMDFETPRGLVSVEMGDTTMGFFTDFPDGGNYAIEGIRTDFVALPAILQHYLS